jgi:hypothetical protein
LASGAPSIKDARASAFINAFSSVAIRVSDKHLPSYVSAAVTLRFDLADKIVATALKSRPFARRPSLELIDRIVRAAVAAAPIAKGAIIHAALETYPSARERILAAAGIAPNMTAMYQLTNVSSTIFAALNENVVIESEENTQSPEQPPSP